MINKKASQILCYCSLIGWLVAYLAGDKDNAKLDINQGLVLSLAEVGIGIIGAIFGLIPVFIMKIIFGLVVWLAEIVCLILAIMGIVNAAQGQEKELPIIGSIKIMK